MRRALPVLFLIILLPFHVIGLHAVTNEWKSLPKGEGAAYVIPSEILKITSVEFDSLVSDFIFLQAIVFIGSSLERTERPRLKEWELQWLYNTLNASADLDPYFQDPYYVGEANLVWEGKVKEANKLLDKGTHHRNWDWLLPFFLGFNHFYFLHEDDKASEYLMEASRRPGASALLASLATRLAYKGNRTANAIIFLQELLKKEEDESVRKEYETRLEALKMIYFLEQAVARYVSGSGKNPSSLKELVSAGIITDIPKDPYGGDFYIDPDGSIKTTSELRPMKKSG